MDHSTKSMIEYAIFAVGILAGIFVCAIPFLIKGNILPESFSFAGKLTPVVGVVVILVTFAWGYWAHQQCKKGVCDLPTAGPKS
jgi:hypothetical protein